MVHNPGWQNLPLLTRQEDMLCALLLPANSTDAELFKFLTTYQENRMGHFVLVYAQTEKLPWLVCFLVSLLCQRGSFWVCLHSIILREMLGTWKMSLKHKVTQDVIKMINCTKQQALNSSLLTQLCEEINAKHVISSLIQCKACISSLTQRRGIAF